MHIVTILRYYLGLTQSELAAKSGVSYVDVSEIENMSGNGMIDKYCRLANCLHVPVHAIAMNDVLSIPETFFRQKRKVRYTDPPNSKAGQLGRLCNELFVEPRQVYKRREKALRKFTIALYGCVES